jgi:hypothetical protein
MNKIWFLNSFLLFYTSVFAKVFTDATRGSKHPHTHTTSTKCLQGMKESKLPIVLVACWMCVYGQAEARRRLRMSRYPYVISIPGAPRRPSKTLLENVRTLSNTFVNLNID